MHISRPSSSEAQQLKARATQDERFVAGQIESAFKMSDSVAAPLKNREKKRAACRHRQSRKRSGDHEGPTIHVFVARLPSSCVSTLDRSRACLEVGACIADAAVRNVFTGTTLLVPCPFQFHLILTPTRRLTILQLCSSSQQDSDRMPSTNSVLRSLQIRSEIRVSFRGGL